MKKLLQFLLLIVAAFHTQAQQVSINVLVTPPYSNNLEDWSGSNTGRLIILISNNTQSDLAIKLAGKIEGDNGVLIRNKRDVNPNSPIRLSAFQNRTLTAGEIGSLFGDDKIDIFGIDKNLLYRNHLIPEGNYTYCLEAYDYNVQGYTSSNLLSASEPLGCVSFPITSLEPPVIMSIGNAICGERIENEEINASFQNLQIWWTRPPQADPRTQFIVTIVELVNNTIDANAAINSATSPPFYTATTSNQFVLLDNTAPKLTVGKRYAIRVQAEYRGQGYRNNGYSEVCSFTYGSAPANDGGNELRITQIYPANGSVIPFQSFPVIVKFDPYNDNFRSFNSTYTLSTGAREVETTTRNLDWPYGPLRTQRRVTGLSAMSQNQSQHIAINRIDNRTGRPFNEYLRGKDYQFTSLVSMDIYNVGTQANGQVTGGFMTGMPQPRLVKPQPNDTVSLNRNISFVFNTGSAPEMIVPPFEIMQVGRNSDPTYFNCQVHEKFLLQVATSPSFSNESIVHTYAESVAGNYDLLTKDIGELKSELYKRVIHDFTPPDTGDYYWRVVWLNDPTKEDDRDIYRASETRRFRVGRVGSEPLADLDSARRRTTPASCIADCEAPTITNRNQVSQLSVGQSVSIGKFRMTITRLSALGGQYSGSGVIAVGFLNCRVRVNFSNIQVNTDLVVFAGSAEAVNDEPVAIPAAFTSLGATFAGLQDAKVQEINRLAGAAGRLVSGLTNSVEIGLPLGLDNTIDGVRTTVAIVGMHFGPDRASLNAMVGLDIPEMNGWLSLAGGDICFHPQGVNTGEGKLYNPTDKTIRFSNDVQMVFTAPNFVEGDSGTYIAWDCSGFKSLQIKGEFRFSRNVFLPDSVNGQAASGIVKAKFSAKVSTNRNWMLGLDMDAFQLLGVPGWGFSPRNIVFDLSSMANAQGMIFPQGYVNSEIGGNSVAWKGFYMRELEVRLPVDFQNNVSSDRRTTFGAYNLLIDRTGISGVILGRNVLDWRNGTVDGWGMGIDSVQMELVSNGFRSAGISGAVKVPIGERPISYTMILNRNSGNFGYQCNIQPQDTLKATIVNPAVLQISPTSRLEITKRANESFQILARLNGAISIQGRIEPVGMVDFRGMSFEDFTVQNRRPYIECRALSFASPDHSAGGFPVTIDSFQFIQTENVSLLEFDRAAGPRVGLSMGLHLNLVRGQRNTFEAHTRIGFMARISTGGTSPFSANFSGLSLEEVAVSGDIGPASISGGLQFYASNPTFGDGIRGYIGARMQPGINLNAIVQFGSVSNNPYFYIDGSLRVVTPLTILPGLAVKGFGGAVYYGMTFSNLPEASVVGSNATPDIRTIGATSSGGTVTPRSSVQFGFLARMYMVPPSGDAYKAMAEIGAEFNNSEGHNMHINGDLIAMTTSDDPRDAKISGEFRLSYNGARRVFDTRCDVFVNFNNTIRGITPRDGKYLAGSLHIYADPNTWFIKVGEPSSRVGLSFGIADFRRTATSYLMVGQDLEPMPPLPIQIQRLLREPIISSRDMRIANGDGFAFGATMDMSVPEIDFLMFYAQMDFILGFDVSLLKTQGVNCSNTATPRGSDGWYTEGQLYAYMHGGIGIKTDVWFLPERIKIVDVELAAAIAGGFPNPNWFRGNVAGSFNMLGGLVKGDFNFPIAVGERCLPLGENPLGNIELVTQLSPSDGQSNVDCGVEPFAVFNIEPGHIDTFSFSDENGNRQLKTFRVMYKNFTLTGAGVSITKANFETPVTGGARFSVSRDGKTIGLEPNSFLPENKTFTLSITAYLEELQNGRWVASRKRTGGNVEKIYTSTFRTGSYPTTIRDMDIMYSYPYRNQRFLLQNECKNGAIQLRRDMSFLFANNEPGGTNTYYVDILPLDGSSEPVRAQITGGSTNNLIRFTIPTLQNNKVYALRVVAKRIYNDAGMNQFVSNNVGQLNSSITQRQIRMQGGNNVTVSNAQAGPGLKVKGNERVMYIYYFKTSAYNTLADKMEGTRSIVGREVNLWDAGDGMIKRLDVTMRISEPFDMFDVAGEAYRPSGSLDNRVWTGGLVQFKHQGTSYDQQVRQQPIYDVYQSLNVLRLVNTYRSYAILNVQMPTITGSMQLSYNASIASTSYVGALTVADYNPAPAGFAGGGFSSGGYNSTASYACTINYTGYQDAHRDKTKLANAVALLNANMIYNSIYQTSANASQRAIINNAALSRRYSGYPTCQNLTFKSQFVLPITCSRDSDASQIGSLYNFNVMYPPCLNGPR